MQIQTVGDLESALFSLFPKSDAEDWDNPGVNVGDRLAPVRGITVNLDMSFNAVIETAKRGCNVLVTHHPAFIGTGPLEFGPAEQASAPAPGKTVFEAARLGVHTIAMHTNLDRSQVLRERYADLLGCSCVGNLEHLVDPKRSPDETGLGALLDFSAHKALTLNDIAIRCEQTFGAVPRVWGDPSRGIHRVAVLNGSANDHDMLEACLRAGISCAIVGELRYHSCVDLQPQLSLIELGHDSSELPIEGILIEALTNFEYSFKTDITKLECSEANWWTPNREA